MLPFSEGRKESALVKEMLLFDSTQHVRKVLSGTTNKQYIHSSDTRFTFTETAQHFWSTCRRQHWETLHCNTLVSGEGDPQGKLLKRSKRASRCHRKRGLKCHTMRCVQFYMSKVIQSKIRKFTCTIPTETYICVKWMIQSNWVYINELVSNTPLSHMTIFSIPLYSSRLCLYYKVQLPEVT